MVSKTFKCSGCGKQTEFSLSVNDDQPTESDKCEHCGKTSKEITWDRRFPRAPAMRNDSVYEPGGLKDWTKTKSLEEQASVWLDEADPY